MTSETKILSKKFLKSDQKQLKEFGNIHILWHVFPASVSSFNICANLCSAFFPQSNHSHFVSTGSRWNPKCLSNES